MSKVEYNKIDGCLDITDFKGYDIRINKGEVICILSQTSEHNTTVSYSSDEPDGKTYTCSTLDGTFVATNNILKFSYKILESNLISSNTIDNINNEINQLNNDISQVSILTDRTTGDNYRIVVNNGAISLKPLTYTNAVIIGSSCVVHGRALSIDYHRTESGSMVPSVSEYTWENFTLKALRQKNETAIIAKGNCAAWERSLFNVVRGENNKITGYTENPSDLSFINSVISENTDLVIMQLMGNTPVEYDSDATKESLTQVLSKKATELLKYIHEITPNSDIYITQVSNSLVKGNALKQSAEKLPYVHYVTINGWAEEGFKWILGDYYAEDNDALGTLYPITHSGVAGHGNEMFYYNATQLMMKAAGYNFIYPTYKIILNKTIGGELTTPNTTWFENSVVNIRCVADSGKTISNIVVENESGTDVSTSVGLTRRDNDYGIWYTFKMPNYNVIVTPTWA